MLYEFKGLVRWSRVNMQKINIHNIIHMTNSKRMFCLFDRLKPYRLDIVHKNDYSRESKFPYYQCTGLTSFRYDTKEECENEIKMITRLKILIPNKEISDNLKATK